MRVVLVAASGYGNAVLARLHAQGHDVPIVVTAARDDQAGLLQAGRPLADLARSLGARVFEGVDAAGERKNASAIAACAPQLLAVVNGYDREVSTHLARLAADAIYAHPSLLPRYRGPSPSNWALIQGDSETGITLARLARRRTTAARFSRSAASPSTATRPTDGFASVWPPRWASSSSTSSAGAMERSRWRQAKATPSRARRIPPYPDATGICASISKWRTF